MASSLAEIRRTIDDILQDFLTRQRTQLEQISPAALSLIDSVEPLLGRGKRIRAALCVWGFEAASALSATADDSDRSGIAADPVPSTVGINQAAASLELLHAAALVHDDLMDNSDTRRGLPATHRWFEATHLRQRLAGDAEAFGQAGALIVGDLCLGWSEELYGSCGIPTAFTPNVLAVRDRMRADVMVGQYLDILGQVDPQQGPAAQLAAKKVLRYKSAKYSVEHPLLLGAALAGAPEELLARLSGFGLPLGEAFQLRDDVLGVFGDPDQTGKPAGDDLREGKRTLLVAFALEKADARGAAVIERLLGDPSLDAAGVETLRGILQETGALRRTEELINALAEQSQAALDDIALGTSTGAAGNGENVTERPAAAEVLGTLAGFIDTVTDRTS
ncbi:polyprenyl synthetase family protein [Saxibacter everestensis]|uniref:Polyprenyl synthetase family protein n=1 Tax=Saxibacter everestensis TaxID=2909229 RepID=A0ABY8QWF1_9MICO|nr:polyprenyl synthetase family protein [Brevibacteriaceae bacterium ZFBP1038]